jgi:hypothetical protein
MEWFIGHQSALEFWREAPAEYALARNRLRTRALPKKSLDASDLHKGNPWLLALPLHILVASDGARKEARNLRCHISSGVFPRNSFIRGDEGLVVSSPELCFVQMATELSFVELMMLGYELCGSYRIDKMSEPERGFRRDLPLTSVAALKSYLGRATGLKGCKNARRALPFITDGSASPMETALTLLLTLPYRLGGYGFAMPQLNCPIEVEVNAREASGRRRKITYFGDLYWPDVRVDVEYDSDTWHLTSEQKAKDSTRQNALLSAGVVVLTVSRKQIMSVSEIRKLAEELSGLLKKRLQPPMPAFTACNFKLWRQLLAT